MGFLFLFFPENETSTAKKKTAHQMALDLLSSPSSFKPVAAFFRRSISATVVSTVSVCALLLFFLTLLSFTVYFDSAANSSHLRPRIAASGENSSSGHALQGMGSLYRRGTRAMNDLVVAHAVDSLTTHELRLFLRLLFRSAVSAKSDVLLIFRSKSAAHDRVVAEENRSFLNLLLPGGGSDRKSMAAFEISDKKMKESGEPIWGRRIRRRNSGGGNETESTRWSYGSVVGFDADELDPENSLAGFLDHVPMSLRRWACYPMILGRVRRNFKRVTLIDPKEFLLLDDPLGRVKNRDLDSVHLMTATHPPPTSKRSEDPDPKQVTPGIVSGGARGVRMFSGAMLTGIVATAMQPKKKKRNSVTELEVLNQLVRNESVLKRLNLVVSDESIPGLSSLAELNSKVLTVVSTIRPGNGNGKGEGSMVILKYLCALFFDSTVYPDC